MIFIFRGLISSSNHIYVKFDGEPGRTASEKKRNASPDTLDYSLAPKKTHHWLAKETQAEMVEFRFGGGRLIVENAHSRLTYQSSNAFWALDIQIDLVALEGETHVKGHGMPAQPGGPDDIFQGRVAGPTTFSA